MNIQNIKFIGEENDTLPNVEEENIVIKTKHNGFKMMDDAILENWDKIFIFPDNHKAEYFANYAKLNMHDYREGMLRDDYCFHIINCVYPMPKEIYADQLYMRKEWKPVFELKDLF